MQGFTIRGIKPFLDLNLPLSSAWAVRVNAAYQHRDGIRNYVDGDRYYIQPSVLWQPNKNTQFVLNYEFLHDRQRPDNGAFVLIPNYQEKPTIYNPSKDKFFGFESDKHQTQQQVVSAKINHTINEYFTFQQQIAFADERIDYYKTGHHAFLKPILSPENNKDTIGYNTILQRKLIQQDDKKQMYYLQTDFIAKNLKHHRIFNHGFQVGLDATYLFEETQTYVPSKNIDEVDISTGLNTLNDTSMSNSPQDLALKKDKLTLKKTLRMSTMLQYQLAITQYVKLIAGGRWTGLQTMNSKDAVNNGWTPLAGIVLYPSKQSQVFFTYTNTFVPSTLRDENSQKALGNDYHTQLELGAKWAFHDKIEFAVTAYQISIGNQIVALVNEANVLSTIYGVRVGSLLNRGLELEMVAKPIKGLELLGGYSFVDARYVKSDKLKDNAVPYNTPKNTFYLWADYSFHQYLKGFSIGLGGNYVGTRYANDQIKVPYHNIPLGAPTLMYAAYFQLDARASYVFKQFSIDLRANNLTNVINYTSYRTQYVNQIDPIHFILTLRYKI
jgi:iron complex outermembrane receptor protein